MSFNSIQAALESSLQTFADFQSVDVAWSGRSYTPSLTNSYLRPTWLPGDTEQVSLGDSGMDRIAGLFQIDIFYPKGEARSLFPDLLASHFSRGTTLQEGSVSVRIRTTSISKTAHEEAWSITPVTVSWETYLEPR